MSADVLAFDGRGWPKYEPMPEGIDARRAWRSKLDPATRAMVGELGNLKLPALIGVYKALGRASQELAAATAEQRVDGAGATLLEREAQRLWCQCQYVFAEIELRRPADNWEREERAYAIIEDCIRAGMPPAYISGRLQEVIDE